MKQDVLIVKYSFFTLYNHNIGFSTIHIITIIYIDMVVYRFITKHLSALNLKFSLSFKKKKILTKIKMS